MNTIKVTVDFVLPGRTLSNENFELRSVKLQDPKTKKSYYRTTEIKSTKLASKQIKWTLSQYLYMTSNQGKPDHIHFMKWNNMNKKERLETYIAEMAADMGATNYAYDILN